jgi:hypothetical protein
VAGRAAVDCRLDGTARYHFATAQERAAGANDHYWQAVAVWSAARWTRERGYATEALKLLQLSTVALDRLRSRIPGARHWPGGSGLTRR